MRTILPLATVLAIICLGALFALERDASAIIRRDELNVLMNVDTGSSITVVQDMGYMSGTIKRMWLVAPALTGTSATYTLQIRTHAGELIALWPTYSGSEATTTAQDMSTTGIVLTGKPTATWTTSEGQSTSVTFGLIMFRDDGRAR